MTDENEKRVTAGAQKVPAAPIFCQDLQFNVAAALRGVPKRACRSMHLSYILLNRFSMFSCSDSLGVNAQRAVSLTTAREPRVQQKVDAADGARAVHAFRCQRSGNRSGEQHGLGGRHGGMDAVAVAFAARLARDARVQLPALGQFARLSLRWHTSPTQGVNTSWRRACGRRPRDGPNASQPGGRPRRLECVCERQARGGERLALCSPPSAPFLPCLAQSFGVYFSVNITLRGSP
ncbi:hypothetical protein [Variovorax paradoxus]|uniref:hypothetical protein n=1 Tax=Variovorax paradoxus TaxID=34073 RepID=UPI0030D1001B